MKGQKITEELVRGLKLPRDPSGNKGSFGQLLVIAGSKYMTGAPCLTVSAALRSGTGLVKLFTSDDAMASVKVNCPCAVLASSDGKDYLSDLDASLRRSSAVAIGPGLDIRDPKNFSMLGYVIDNSRRLIIDASALTLLSKHGEEGLRRLKERTANGLEPAVLTPHIGEFKRFGYEDTDFEDLESGKVCDLALDFAKKTGSVLVLKNHVTMITTPEGKCYYIKGDNSGMAKGGSGDVLTGLIGGFMASGMKGVNAALCGVYVHSRAGALASSELGELYMLPSDLIDRLTNVYKGLGW